MTAGPLLLEFSSAPEAALFSEAALAVWIEYPAAAMGSVFRTADMANSSFVLPIICTAVDGAVLH